MLHFNDLYVTEDGNHLVIDVQIDDLEVYSQCSISRITVNVLGDDCTTDSSKAVTVFEGGTGAVYVDMDGDGIITDIDRALVDRLMYLLDCIRSKNADFINNYDVNRDGIVDIRDFNALIDRSLKKPAVEGYHYDINGDTESGNQGDIDAWINGVLEFSTDSDELKELLRQYNNAYEYLREVTEPSRHAYLCLSKTQVYSLLEGKTFGDRLFLVEVEANVKGNLSAIEGLGCGWDVNVIRGLAYNDKKLYDTAVSFASSYGDDCDNNDAGRFMDFVLRYYSFIFAVKCGDIPQACYYWNHYLSGNVAGTDKFSTGKRGCGCHGTYW